MPISLLSSSRLKSCCYNVTILKALAVVFHSCRSCLERCLCDLLYKVKVKRLCTWQGLISSCHWLTIAECAQTIGASLAGAATAGARRDQCGEHSTAAGRHRAERRLRAIQHRGENPRPTRKGAALVLCAFATRLKIAIHCHVPMINWLHNLVGGHQCTLQNSTFFDLLLLDCVTNPGP